MLIGTVGIGINMKEYLISVIWVSIIVGICELIAPHSEGIKKNLKIKITFKECHLNTRK